MATITERFGFTKPAGSDPASIVPLNSNTDLIELYLGRTQDMIAPMYDDTATYDVGDIVTYESNLYKCITAISTAETFDPTKWEATTAVDEGGGADLDIYGEASGTAEASFSDGAEASLVECEIGIVPSQDLHGYDSPWVGGAGKNKFPMTVEGIKALNTAGTWSENVYTYKNVSYSILTDNENNITGLGISGTNTERSDLLLPPPLLSGLSNIAFSARFISGSPVRALRFQMYGGTGTARDRYINADPTESTWSVDGEYTVVALSAYQGSGDIAITLQIEEGSTPTSFAPYSNICPISGHTDATVTVASTSGGSGDDYTVSLGTTYYGGELDVITGELNVTWGNIASYAGETLTGEWLSSLDEYTALGTPTTGAQVVYELATPQTFNLTPTQVKTLLGQNYVSHDGGGTISLVYIKKDSTIIPNPSDAEVPLTGLEISGKDFVITDARIPAPPTTNGAYVLTVTVSGGTPTYSWENA